MRITFLLCFYLALSSQSVKVLKEFDTHPNEFWNQWKSEHKKVYNSISEELTRRSIFYSNLKRIEELNSKRQNEFDAKFDLNQFSDLTKEELSNRLLKKNRNELKMFSKTYSNYKLPVPSGDVPLQYSACAHSKVLYNYKGNDTDLCGKIVFDQGECGSCYAVANAHELQLKYANLTLTKTGKPEFEMFSPQMLMDCVENGQGCNGGYTDDPLRSSHYVVSLSNYSYLPYLDLGTKGQCQKNKWTPIMATYTLFASSEHFEIIKRILYYYGSFVSCVYVSDDWYSYKSNIFSSKCEKGIMTNHIIEVVGYGQQDGINYIIVRNSWGSSWGIDGYIKIREDSLCGIGGDDGGLYPVSIIQHVDFSDLERGPYGKKSFEVEVEKELYDGNDKYLIYQLYPTDEPSDSDDYIYWPSLLSLLMMFLSFLIWVICVILISILSCCLCCQKED